jgi:diguanylate cyclase (GGDEF)-like protein
MTQAPSPAPKPDYTAEAESILGRVMSQLAALEKRDSELWVIVVLTSTLIAAGLLVTIAPGAFSNGGNLHFEVSIPKEIFLSLVALIALLNVYLVSQRLEFRRTRQALISTSIQGELTRLQSFTDPLTEIYNRRSLEEMVRRFTSQARRASTPLTLLMADVDRFKEVNTRFGHLTGDMVLTEMAALLKNCVRGSDAVIRYGGDEFLVILADSDREGALRVIDRIHTFLDEWNAARPLKNFKVSLSVGMSEWHDGKRVDQMLDEADEAMFLEKRTALVCGP